MNIPIASVAAAIPAHTVRITKGFVLDFSLKNAIV